MALINIHKLEQTIVNFLNFDGWDIKWTGEGFAHIYNQDIFFSIYI